MKDSRRNNQTHPKKARGWNNRTSRYPLTSPAHDQDVEPPEENPKTTKVLKNAKSGELAEKKEATNRASPNTKDSGRRGKGERPDRRTREEDTRRDANPKRQY